MIDPSLRSTGTLGDNVTGTGPLGYGDVTHLMWPTYKRLTSARGGDVSAGFTFVDVEELYEYWLEEGLGQTFTESFAGSTCFYGRLSEVRVVIGVLSLKATLDTVFNKIACYYTSVVDNTTDITEYAEDTDSQAKWGTRVLHYRPTEYMDYGEALDTANALLRRLAQPRVLRGPLAFGTRQPACQLKFDGFAASLDVETYVEPSEGYEDASAHVATVLSGASLVSADSITVNTTQVPIQSDYRSKLQRLHWLAERRDSSGRDYRYGCFGSRQWDYAPIDPTQIRYRVHAKQPRYQVRDSVSGEVVPDPLLQPGYYSFAADIMPGRPLQDPRDDFRVQLDLSVEYSAQGAIPRPLDWTVEDNAASIAMAILAERES